MTLNYEAIKRNVNELIWKQGYREDLGTLIFGGNLDGRAVTYGIEAFGHATDRGMRIGTMIDGIQYCIAAGQTHSSLKEMEITPPQTVYQRFQRWRLNRLHQNSLNYLYKGLQDTANSDHRYVLRRHKVKIAVSAFMLTVLKERNVPLAEIVAEEVSRIPQEYLLNMDELAVADSKYHASFGLGIPGTQLRILFDPLKSAPETKHLRIE